MTANVRIVTEQRPDVLRVPNAALRFRPPGVEADRPQRPGGGGSAQPGGRGPSGTPRATGVGMPGRVWIATPDGKAEAVAIRLGITDGTSTEVLEGPLKDKQEVIVGLSGTGAPKPTTPGGPRLL